VLVVLFIVQVSQILRVNHDVLNNVEIPAMQKYPFKQVAILNVAYLVTFGSELAVVSMLPLFFMETFELTAVKAGMLASGFAFMNLLARPSGGYLSDRFGRRRSLSILICGLAVGYMLLSQITSTWPLLLAVLATMCCSFFVQAGEGAVFAIVPLVKRSMTGQIAGMTGAYGNVGAVIFLTVLSFVDASSFFMVIAACAAFVFVAVQFMEEPQGHIAEYNDDGSVALIEVS
jgi:NNP family nitrate/nitrite transporter-like MFS transporter